MKGQFFVMSTVIMVYTLMSLIQYVYDFDINLIDLKRMPELEYIQYVKDSLNSTLFSSRTSLDCAKADSDITSTENFLKNEMAVRGMNLTTYHSMTSCNPISAYFNFTIRTATSQSFTEFISP